MSFPQKPSGEAAETLDRLTALGGKQLDTEYLSALIADHEHAVGLFRREARDGQDPDIRSFAVATVPKLEHHLQLMRDVQSGKATMKMGDAANTTTPTAPARGRRRT